MKTLTKTAAIAAIRAMGLTATAREGELRVNYRKADGGTEESAYYTDDAQDALDTARVAYPAPGSEAWKQWRKATQEAEAQVGETVRKLEQ